MCDSDGGKNIGKESTNKVLKIVSKITRSQRPILPTTDFEKRMTEWGILMMKNAIPPAAVMFLVALFAVIFHSHPLVNTMLVLAIICESLIIAFMFFEIVGGTPFLWKVRKNPYMPFLSLLTMSTEFDTAFIDELKTCDKGELQYVLMQYKQSRNEHERRTGMVAGAIDKIGMFPAIAGLVITISNLSRISTSIAWGSMLGPLLVVFYVLAVSATEMTKKMDRVIGLLEFSIETMESPQKSKKGDSNG